MEKIDFMNCLGPSTQIGRVRFNDETSAIYIEATPEWNYVIDTERCRTAGQALDWIHQVCVDKVWGKEVSNDMLNMIFIVLPSSVWRGKA